MVLVSVCVWVGAAIDRDRGHWGSKQLPAGCSQSKKCRSELVALLCTEFIVWHCPTMVQLFMTEACWEPAGNQFVLFLVIVIGKLWHLVVKWYCMQTFGRVSTWSLPVVFVFRSSKYVWSDHVETVQIWIESDHFTVVILKVQIAFFTDVEIECGPLLN